MPSAPEAEVEVEGLDLNPRQIAFTVEYLNGEHAGNATRAYEKVYQCSATVAQSNSSRLLQHAMVKELMARFHQNAVNATGGTFIAWSELVPLAQGILVATARGQLRNRLAFEAAKELLNRALGQPSAVQEFRLSPNQIEEAVKKYRHRIHIERTESVSVEVS